MIGNPTPVEIPFVPEMQLPRADVPNPIAPQTLALPAVDRLLGDQQLRRFSISRRSARKTSSSTCTRWGGTRSSAAAATTGRFTRSGSKRRARDDARRRERRPAAAAAARRRAICLRQVLRDPAARDPRGFVLPAGSAGFPDRHEVREHADQGRRRRRTARRRRSRVGGKQYPAGSYVVKAAQAFRAARDGHVRAAGSSRRHSVSGRRRRGRRTTSPATTSPTRWASSSTASSTAFDGPFEKLADVVPPPPGTADAAPRRAAAICCSHEVNDAFVAVNRLLKAGEEVHWLKSPFDGQRPRRIRPARCIIPAKPTTLPILQKLAADKGLSFETVAAAAGGRRR